MFTLFGCTSPSELCSQDTLALPQIFRLFQEPKKSLLKSSHPKKVLAQFSYPKKSFDQASPSLEIQGTPWAFPHGYLSIHVEA